MSNTEYDLNAMFDSYCDDMLEEDISRGHFQPENLEEFTDIVNKAETVFKEVSFSDDKKPYYAKIFSDMKMLENIELDNPKVLKAFLACKKLVKYRDKVSIERKPGHFDETSPFLGEYAQYHKQLEKKSASFLILSDALYRPEVTFSMIPKEDREEAEILGKEMLQKELAKYNVTPEKIFKKPIDYFRNYTACCDIDNPWNDWCLQVTIDNQISQIEGEQYAPLGVIALHELGHVRQTMPGVSEHKFDHNKFAELAPTIDLLARQDEIYKKIHNIPLRQEVDYPQSIELGGKLHNSGEIVNTFRQIKEKYHFDNFEQVLLTKEAEEYIHTLTGIQKTKNKTQISSKEKLKKYLSGSENARLVRQKKQLLTKLCSRDGRK